MLFETRLFDKDNFMSYLFLNPIEIIIAKRLKDVPEAFAKIEKYSKKFYLAGYFAYEAGYFFEKNSFCNNNLLFCYPLVHFAVFDKRYFFNHKTGEHNINIPQLFSQDPSEKRFCLYNLRVNISFAEYEEKISQIKKCIQEGLTYQVNFTFKYNFNFFGCAFAFYQKLSQFQPVPYAAFCKMGRHQIISLSPELFLRKKDRKIFSQPMKGTMPRGKDAKEDYLNLMRLKKSLKDKAENLMIIDLVRNDLGRISEIGSVRVREPFKVRKYKTIIQMTSQVESILKKGISYYGIFKNIFPGGSVTGAPKIKTMQIIQELEKEERGVYCGALGFIAKKEAVFNLPIRTISLLENKGEMGVGSGIVWDSSAKKEFAECQLKGAFLRKTETSFGILESILWKDGFKFLKEHLERMRCSADYFGFVFEQKRILRQLEKTKERLQKGKEYKVRLILEKDGKIKVNFSILKQKERINYIAISSFRTDPNDIFLYHKTTNRFLYEREYLRYRRLGFFDVIFLNNKGEVTEGAISNVIIEKKGLLYTPPLSSGLLPGVYRDYLLKKGRVKQKTLFLKDLYKAKRIFLCNSVRGLVEVRLKEGVNI